MEYLEEEDLQYILSEQCQKILSDHEASVDHLNSIRDSSNRFKAGKLDVKDFGEFRNFVENRITRKLREHQLKAAYHLYITQNGANFSAPGSGKTTVVLTVYEKLKSEGKVNCLYVVGPPACFGPWKTEFFETLGRIPNAKIFAGGDKNVRKNEYYGPPSSTEELYLSTFQTVSNDISDVKSFFNLRGVFPMLVVDEAHYIKQQGGVWANALLELSICGVKTN
ncbi:MAG: DEAD/DEAH box helicase family protein [Ignavibacteriales bacterium]|nr:DEAD/DEAH box helicase family protein [Ignavibacteriales bacterium]